MPIRLLIVLLLSCLTTAGCTSLWQTMQGGQPRQGTSSSVVDFLYPKGERPPEVSGVIPNLNVPLRVGVAFVPSLRAQTGLSEARQNQLLETSKASFSDQDFISEIVIIPETYMRSRRGFETLDQVARLYNLDVIALVSYDQVSVAEDKRASLLYWTIVGAYVIKGSRNDVQTFVDTAIFDVPTRRLLFRAAGTDLIQSSSTLIDSATKMREARDQSFSNAMSGMTVNLAAELKRFQAKIKTDKSVVVTSRSGGGMGAVDTGLLVLLVLLALSGLLFRPGASRSGR